MEELLTMQIETRNRRCEMNSCTFYLHVSSSILGYLVTSNLDPYITNLHDFIEKIRQTDDKNQVQVGNDVIVIGAGNTAIDAAVPAQKAWAATPAKTRAMILRRWYDLVIENTDDLATILTSEMGKPLAEAKGEIAYGSSFIDWFGEEARRVCHAGATKTKLDRHVLCALVAH